MHRREPVTFSPADRRGEVWSCNPLDHHPLPGIYDQAPVACPLAEEQIHRRFRGLLRVGAVDIVVPDHHATDTQARPEMRGVPQRLLTTMIAVNINQVERLVAQRELAVIGSHLELADALVEMTRPGWHRSAAR